MKILALILGLTGFSSAIHLPVQRIRPRASPGSTLISKPTGCSALTNTQNILYTAEVTVGTATYTLQLDTGSSDLWFSPIDPGFSQTFAPAIKYPNWPVNLTYGSGWAQGYVAQIGVEFAGFCIQNQSFALIQEMSSSNLVFQQQHPAYQGIAGLSFDTLSRVNMIVVNNTNSTWGRSLMSNIFLSDPNAPNHIAFFLDRTGDLNSTDIGYFDIGTYATGYEAVASEPKNPVFSGYNGITEGWNVLVNGLSINCIAQALQTAIVVNATRSITNVPPAGSISALMDTGTSFAQIPAAAFQALYTAMGGVLIQGTLSYAVPCMSEVQVIFTIGNQLIPIHPLDLTSAQVTTLGNGQNMTVCLNTFSPSQYEGGDNDIILGDPFLRNVYAVYNYGNFVNTESGLATQSPFIQVLPLTDPNSASAEFKQARSATLALLPPQVDPTTINDPIPKPLNSTTQL